MDFIDQMNQFSKRVEQMIPNLQTEEATKMSLIVPFFQILGYDVFNPAEFMPEYTADVGIKKGEKVDYAIMDGDKPVILIEAKWCGDTLDKHDSQLFRYFGVTSARFGILTNGIIYKFYTDLDEQNKMDLTPFLEVDLLNLKPAMIMELKKFHKDNFSVEDISSTASELKYSKNIREFMQRQLESPSDDFVKYILSEIYTGSKTQNVIERFKPIIKKSLNTFISELMNDKISAALKNDTSNPDSDNNIEKNEENANEEHISKIHTTDQELEAFYIVKSILAEIMPLEKISYKDTETYFGILIDSNIRKWVCRLRLDGRKKSIAIPDENKKEVRHDIESNNDLYSLKNDLLEAAKRYLD
ncbi:type I restriction endonuclease [Ructibacterium gallinarum]|uniref:Type I restriction enzyme HsdR N-terminal domain-containing protein n=1 Tax=Ructibacterium gallinarum TaxID=2779355 RepID=A0A9D5M625_9FIRM|nr:type I restriction endonuclease [Ructibacterium gallinarum]MBE5041270.1 type I restriction enzyme HsdR N-terminal domain-containing protein [Ructibacterium gallinarum]